MNCSNSYAAKFPCEYSSQNQSVKCRARCARMWMILRGPVVRPKVMAMNVLKRRLGAEMLPQGRVVMGVRMDVVKGVAPLPIKLLVLLCREELAVTIPVPAAAVRSIRSATARKSSHLIK